MNRYLALIGLLALLISGTAAAARPANSVSQSIKDGTTLSGSITWTATPAPAGGVSSVDFFIDGVNKWTANRSPYQFNGYPDGQVDTTTLSNGSHTFRVTATWSRRATASNSVTVTVSNNVTPPSGDTTPPTVSWVRPVNGATVSGILNESVGPNNCEAQAADNVGIDHVDMLFDGALLNTEREFPYNCVVDTTKYPDGQHTLTAKAFDAVGDNASATITVTVANNASPPPPPPPPAPGSANLWVDTNGGSCTRQPVPGAYIDVQACGNFQTAYNASAAGGDTILVGAGNYPGDQNIVQNGHSQSGPMTTFKCVTARACVIGAINLGQNNGALSGVGPSWLSFDGFDMKRWGAQGVGGTNPHDITLRNNWLHFWNEPAPPASSWYWPLVGCCANNLTVTNNEIGPSCCNGGGVESGAPNNFLFADNYVHDIYDTCGSGDGGMNRYGSQCQGYGWGDGCGTCDHVDGMQLQGGSNVRILNNRIYNAGTQAVFLENAFQINYTNLTIAGNAVSRVCGGKCGNDFSLYSNTAAGYKGTTNILYNTVQGVAILGGGSANALSGTVNVVGNIFFGSFGAPSGCGSSSGTTFVYRNNLRASGTCDASDKVGVPSLVSTDLKTPDFHLSGTQKAVNGGESVFCGAGKTVASDFDGEARAKGVACDIGADEAG